MEKTLKFIFKVEKAQYWDEIAVEEYQDNLSDYDLDYNSYDDPDIMWNDFLNAVIDYDIKYIEDNSDYNYHYNDTECEHKFSNENEVISVIDWYGNKVKVIDELEDIINIECN